MAPEPLAAPISGGLSSKGRTDHHFATASQQAEMNPMRRRDLLAVCRRCLFS